MSIPSRIPVSVRITQEDADFIAALSLEGAHTASEKIRALLTQARLQHEQSQDFSHQLHQAQQMLSFAKEQVATWETGVVAHSSLLARSFETLPELVAFLAAAVPSDAPDLKQMQQYEAGVASRLVHLIESILQLAVTGQSPCYDKAVLSKQLQTVLALAQIILQQPTAALEGEKNE